MPLSITRSPNINTLASATYLSLRIIDTSALGKRWSAVSSLPIDNMIAPYTLSAANRCVLVIHHLPQPALVVTTFCA